MWAEAGDPWLLGHAGSKWLFAGLPSTASASDVLPRCKDAVDFKESFRGRQDKNGMEKKGLNFKLSP